MSEIFPEIVLEDGTYNVNKAGMPLYSFMVEDGFGHGRVVFYGIVSDNKLLLIMGCIQIAIFIQS